MENLKRAKTQDEVMGILNEKMPSRIDARIVLERAVSAFDQVTKEKMKELESIYNSDKRDKRVLFLKDEDSD